MRSNRCNSPILHRIFRPRQSLGSQEETTTGIDDGIELDNRESGPMSPDRRYSTERDDARLLKPSQTKRHGRRAAVYCCHVLGGSIAGLAFATLVGLVTPGILVAFVGYDLLPTIIHRIVLFCLLWVLGPIVGTIWAVSVRACKCCSCRSCSCRGYGLSVAVGTSVCGLALVLACSQSAQDELYRLLYLLVLGGGPFGGAAYCEAAAAATATRLHAGNQSQSNGTAPQWWLAWGSEPGSAAASLVRAMTADERASLLNGEGWYIVGPRVGAYVGGTPAVPRLGIPAIKMQDAGQGFRTMHRSQVGTVTSWPCLLALAASWDARLTRIFAEALADEFKLKGANVLLGPSVNVQEAA